jgi:hypothetical protein
LEGWSSSSLDGSRGNGSGGRRTGLLRPFGPWDIGRRRRHGGKRWAGAAHRAGRRARRVGGTVGFLAETHTEMSRQRPAQCPVGPGDRTITSLPWPASRRSGDCPVLRAAVAPLGGLSLAGAGGPGCGEIPILPALPLIRRRVEPSWPVRRSQAGSARTRAADSSSCVRELQPLVTFFVGNNSGMWRPAAPRPATSRCLGLGDSYACRAVALGNSDEGR